MTIKNPYTVFVFLIIIVSISTLQGQVDTVWTKTFGGNAYDAGISVQQTTDGGYIIGGFTGSFGSGGYDFWLIKTDASGDTIWTKTYGGYSTDLGHSVEQTNDGGYIFTGVTRSFGAGNGDVWLIKTDSSGDTLWTKTYGGTDYDGGNSVQQTTDEGYIITGWTESFGSGFIDLWLIKTDSSGETLWTKTFGEINEDEGYSVQQTADGGYILAGSTRPENSQFHFQWLIKTDASGNKQWSRYFYDGNAMSVQQTLDGGYITTGAANDPLNNDLLVLKTDSSGNDDWKIYYNCDYCPGNSIKQTIDGGYIIAGSTSTNPNVLLIKLTAFGDILWTKTFGGYYNDEGYSVQQTTDNGFIITGYTKSYGSGGGDVWLIKTTPDISDVEPNAGRIPSDFSLSQNYPNPFNPTTTITYKIPQPEFVSLKVYDILGREVATLVNEEKPAGSYELQFEGRGLTSGIYFYQLKTGIFVETKKMVLLK